MKFNEYRKILTALVVQATKSVATDRLEKPEPTELVQSIITRIRDDLSIDLDTRLAQNDGGATLKTLLKLEEMGVLQGTNFVALQTYYHEKARRNSSAKPFTFGGDTGEVVLNIPNGFIGAKFRDVNDQPNRLLTQDAPDLQDIESVKALCAKIYLTKDVQSEVDKAVDTLEMLGVDTAAHFDAILAQ